jgi:chromate reductase, NAD(P)H dehydrogenase (quinone)
MAKVEVKDAEPASILASGARRPTKLAALPPRSRAEELAIQTSKAVARPVMILGIPGSLRESSYNKLLLRAASKLLPPSVQLEIIEIDKIPLYNQDVEVAGLPEPVKAFKKKIEEVDAILISTPEYNHSFPGMLKNAIDWASRPYGHNSFEGKPTAVMSASPGFFGGVSAQDQLKQVLLALNTRLVTKPAVIVTSANQKFDQNRNLLDQNTKQFMLQLITNLVKEAKRFAKFEQTVEAPKIQPLIVRRAGSEKYLVQS